MKKNDLPRVNRLIKELIQYQKIHSDPIHTVKSLCDLAMKAEGLGYKSLALGLTSRGVKLKPDDGWAWTQHGGALLEMGHAGDALKAFSNAEAFGEVVFAKTGRAEVYKAMGRFDEALAAYQEVIQDHPENVFAKNGRAEVYKAIGKFDEALAAYQEVIQNHPEDAVAKTGRAEVYKAMGKFDEALVFYQDTLRSHPTDVVSRNGLCSVLAAMKRYDDALRFLPTGTLDTIQDWVGSHIRGMILLRKGQVGDALSIFQRGVNESPFYENRGYFQTALAIVHLSMGDFYRSSELLNEVESPLLQPKVDLLLLHACGEMGEVECARSAYDKVVIGPWARRDPVAELERRYIFRKQALHDDNWVVDKEIEFLLAA